MKPHEGEISRDDDRGPAHDIGHGVMATIDYDGGIPTCDMCHAHIDLCRCRSFPR